MPPHRSTAAGGARGGRPSPHHRGIINCMQAPQRIETERTVLRRWKDSDREPFAAYNADARVMTHFPRVLTREESDAMVDRTEADFDRQGFGLWAVEVPGLSPFAGFVGLEVPGFDAPFMPAVEVGWRFGCAAWGRGLAFEAAVAALHDAFDRAGLDSVVSRTVPANRRSRRLMERLGMSHDPTDDFDHPHLPESSRVRRHLLYRLAAADFESVVQ